MKSCQDCIHLCVCDKQKVTNHKISKSVCKHFKDHSCAVDLSHVMLLEVDEDYGSFQIPKVILYNENHVTQEEALQIARAGEYHPSVLTLPKRQWASLFLNQNE